VHYVINPLRKAKKKVNLSLQQAVEAYRVVTLRIPPCLDNRLTDGGKVLSLTHRPCSTPQEYYSSASDTHFCYRLSEPQGLVRPEGLGNQNNILILYRKRKSTDKQVMDTRTLQCIAFWMRLFGNDERGLERTSCYIHLQAFVTRWCWFPTPLSVPVTLKLPFHSSDIETIWLLPA
jgi:hypothetical protein